MKLSSSSRLRQYVTPVFSLGVFVTFLIVLALASDGLEVLNRLAVVG